MQFDAIFISSLVHSSWKNTSSLLLEYIHKAAFPLAFKPRQKSHHATANHLTTLLRPSRSLTLNSFFLISSSMAHVHNVTGMCLKKKQSPFFSPNTEQSLQRMSYSIQAACTAPKQLYPPHIVLISMRSLLQRTRNILPKRSKFKHKICNERSINMRASPAQRKRLWLRNKESLLNSETVSCVVPLVHERVKLSKGHYAQASDMTQN